MKARERHMMRAKEMRDSRGPNRSIYECLGGRPGQPYPMRGAATVCLLLIGFGVFLSACSKTDDRVVVAGIDNLEITDRQYLIALKNYYRDTGQAVNLSRDLKEAVLGNLLNRYAGVTFARDKGWADDHEALFQRDLIERKVLVEEYQRRMIFDEVYVTDEDLRELFLRLNTRLRASHLYAPNRRAADSLHQLLKSGADFEQLARRVFRSARLVEGAGDLGFFTVDDMDVAFEDAAYRMDPGEISAPVRTSTGFSIIKLTERRERPIITETEYAAARNRIYPLAVDQKKELATRADIEEKIRQFNIPGELVARLWEIIRDSEREALPGYAGPGPLPAAHRDLGSALLVNDASFKFTVDAFLQEAFYTPAEDWREIRQFHQFLDYLEGVVYRTYAIHAIRNSRKLDREFVDGAVQETFFSYLYRRFDAYIDGRIEVTDAELRREYQENPNEYVAPVSLRLRELAVSTKADAEAAYGQLKQGADFETVFNRYAIDDELKAWGGDLGFIDLDRFGTLSVPLADVKPGEVRGPFQLQENRFVIFECIERREARQLSFEEAVPEARDFLHHTKKEAVREQLLAEVKSRHNAFMDLEKLDQLKLEL